MSEPKPTRQAKNQAIKRIDKAIPKEKKYRKRGLKEKRRNDMNRENRKRQLEERRIKVQEEEGRRELPEKDNLDSEDAQTEEEPDTDASSTSKSPAQGDNHSDIGTPTREESVNTRKRKREPTPPPPECVICSEEIFEVIQKAQNEGKGGLDGGLVLWSCDQRDCGACEGFADLTPLSYWIILPSPVFCISCAIQYIDRGANICPACRREWNVDALKDQARTYGMNLGDNDQS